MTWLYDAIYLLRDDFALLFALSFAFMMVYLARLVRHERRMARPEGRELLRARVRRERQAEQRRQRAAAIPTEEDMMRVREAIRRVSG